ncbi:glycosyltransferase [uncultured Bradyrhizobium sp.]|uniref:glycosyltransferase n=1 Tax=uncultured Bradyrhizobium sp. TaxID=199684 RepID=UPI0035CA636B
MPSYTAIFTICSNNYMPYARTLLASVARYHPDAVLFLGLADEKISLDNFYPERAEVLQARDLHIPDFPSFAFQYDILEFNTAIKPFIFLELFARGYRNVIYLDADILLFRPLTSVLDSLADGANFVLTPHLCKPAEDSDQNDIYIMRAGAYNLGFLGCRWHPETEDILHWWRRHLRFDCIRKVEDGLFVDQKFFDLVPGFTSRVHILRDATLNAAYFNLNQRELGYDGTSWSVDGQPLTFFHFSGIDPDDPTALSKYTRRFRGADISPALAALIRCYQDRLRANGFGAVGSESYAYGHFASGTLIPLAVRRMFQEQHAPWGGDPFQTYEEFIHLPAFAAPRHAPTSLITNLLYYLWTTHPSLTRAFDLARAESADEFLRWCLNNLVAHLQFDHRLVEPVAERTGQRPPSAVRPAESNVKRPDVTLVGYFKLTGGIGEVARQTFRCLSRGVLTVDAHDMSPTLEADRRNETSGPSRFSERIEGRVQIYNMNADQLSILAAELRTRRRDDAYRIAVPFWELYEFPDAWRESFDEIDEIWAPTRFIQAALVRKLSRPVIRMPIALTFKPPHASDREKLGLPKSKFLFFFSFDVLSFYDRKNPAAVYRAFRKAFPPGTAANVGLVLKCLNGSFVPAKLASLHGELSDDPDVLLIEQTMCREEVLALLNAVDCVVSLHRAEGLGLLVSEAIMLGKPVIATDYSGTTELVLPQTGFPVEYRLIPVLEGQYPHAAGQWAEPDELHAAWLMRRVYAEPDAAAQKARRARDHLEQNYGFSAVAAKQDARLSKIRLK